MPSVRGIVARLVREGPVDAAYGDLLLSLLDDTVAEGGVSEDITLLPALACAAHGGDPQRAIPACAAWLLVRLAAKLFDDVEDGDLAHGQPVHVNAATGLLALAHLSVEALTREGVPRSRVARIGAELWRTVLRAAGGQHRDLVAQDDADGLDPDGWLVVAAAKSGALLAWATWAGAAIAGARGRRLEAYRQFGECLGVLLQIADDYNDTWAPDAAKGPIFDAPSLALAYARLVTDGATRQRLDQDVTAARAGNALARGRVLSALTALGGQAFVLAAGQAQRRLAIESLQSAGAQPLADGRLVHLLDGVMPVLEQVSHDADR